jgi:hypothetical protein
LSAELKTKAEKEQNSAYSHKIIYLSKQELQRNAMRQKGLAKHASMLVHERKKFPWPSVDSLQKNVAFCRFKAA